ncbi:hypothetical protein QYF61_027598 [Mycteria americana]|uniref:Uncharacterized protein n=1 Tax=Mycteria americana TaxID=33587 RepID=A0AAN7RLA6_MYCAM|nr:hypothetical protein QYF61_027598 [Mycteria americana]
MGRPGRLILSHSHKPAKASTTCLQWWKQPPDGWKHILYPMPPATTLSWALKSKSYGNMTPQEERSAQEMGGGTARTADPNWPKGYSILYDVMLSNKSWAKKEQGLKEKAAAVKRRGGTAVSCN